MVVTFFCFPKKASLHTGFFLSAPQLASLTPNKTQPVRYPRKKVNFFISKKSQFLLLSPFHLILPKIAARTFKNLKFIADL